MSLATQKVTIASGIAESNSVTLANGRKHYLLSDIQQLTQRVIARGRKQ